MKVTINAEITKQVAMHDASEPYMLYETNVIGADGSPVLITSRTMGKLWNPIEEPEAETTEETKVETIDDLPEVDEV